jgi:hypothetical protein
MSRDSSILASAALRHVRDAEHLLTGGYTSPDQAYHLAGFGPECARKATLSVDWFDQVLGHEIGGAADRVLEVAIALDPQAARYGLVAWDQQYKELAKWRTIVRYEKTGTRTRGDAELVVADARSCVDEIVYSLWLDGRVDGGLA